MAITNQERVGKAMDLLRAGLASLVEREFKTLDKAAPSTPHEGIAGMGMIVRLDGPES